jgi:hypothetical protein
MSPVSVDISVEKHNIIEAVEDVSRVEVGVPAVMDELFRERKISLFLSMIEWIGKSFIIA